MWLTKNAELAYAYAVARKRTDCAEHKRIMNEQNEERE